jgi:hypothetical protein
MMANVSDSDISLVYAGIIFTPAWMSASGPYPPMTQMHECVYYLELRRKRTPMRRGREDAIAGVTNREDDSLETIS